MIHVCSLSRLHQTVARTGARRVISLISRNDNLRCPDGVAATDHLWLPVHDIVVETDGFVVPAETHVAELLRFVRDWDRAAPLVVHCWAGISRSTAGAFAAVCALSPRRSELDIAQAMRRASQTATPNARIVAIADQMLGRDGRMIAAVEAIGRGEFAEEAMPFRLDLE